MRTSNGINIAFPQTDIINLDEENSATKYAPATIEDDKISSAGDEISLTTGELSQWMAKLPPNMKIRLESDGHYFEHDFLITHAWPDNEDKETLILYGNEIGW